MTTTISSQQPVNQFFFSRAHSKCGTFEGKMFIVYDYHKDPFDGEVLACISALDSDVAACEINTSGFYQMLAVPDPFVWSLVGAITGSNQVPDYFRYVILDAESTGEVQS